MLRNINDFLGHALEAAEGKIGEVRAFLFDSRQWVVRYFVVETSPWIEAREVLISTAAVRASAADANTVPVALTRAQIRSAPDIEADKPVSLQQEAQIVQYYGWPEYWKTGAVYNRQIASAESLRSTLVEECEAVNRHLWSTGEVFGYAVRAVDGEIGGVRDLVVDDASWQIRYLVIDSGRWLSGRKVLVSPDWISEIKWSMAEIHTCLEQNTIRRSPSYDPSKPITREYEDRLYDYYGVPREWRRY